MDRSPLTDRLQGGKVYRICNRCVMDTSDPEIKFDAEGFCNLCAEYLRTRADATATGGANTDELNRVIEDIRTAGRGRPYDCLIGMSGGVDSSYLARIVTKDFGLRPLAVHMDNGWDSADSVRNIRSVVAALGIDYESVVLDWPEFRDLQIAFLRASVPEAETPTDMAISEALHATAERYDIRYILNAGNLATEGILPRTWHYNARDRRYFSSICTRYGAAFPATFTFYDYKREMHYKLRKGIRTIYPLNYLRFTKEDVIEVLQCELGFRYYGQKHHESWYTKFVQGYYLFVKFGIDYRRATASSLIMDGQITRDAALAGLEELPYKQDEIAEDKRYIAAKLEITSDELDEIIAQPPKWYHDYPNDERKLSLIYGAYRRLYGKKKLANA